MAITRKNRVYFTTATTTKDRFKTNDKPIQSNFSHLFNSVAFINESDDTATTSAQGLVKLSDDTSAYSADSTADSDNFALVVRPHQLPIVAASTGISVASANNSTGRTGGTGARYTVSNTMTVTGGSFITVTQTGGAGNNVTLGVDTATLNTVVDGLTVINTAQTDIATLQSTMTSEQSNIDYLQAATQDAWTSHAVTASNFQYLDAAYETCSTGVNTPTGNIRYKKMTISGASNSKITSLYIYVTGIDTSTNNADGAANGLSAFKIINMPAAIAPEYDVRMSCVVRSENQYYAATAYYAAAATEIIVVPCVVPNGNASATVTRFRVSTDTQLFLNITYESDF